MPQHHIACKTAAPTLHMLAPTLDEAQGGGGGVPARLSGGQLLNAHVVFTNRNHKHVPKFSAIGIPRSHERCRFSLDGNYLFLAADNTFWGSTWNCTDPQSTTAPQPPEKRNHVVDVWGVLQDISTQLTALVWLR